MTNTIGIARLLTLISMTLLCAAGRAPAQEMPPPPEFYEEAPQADAPNIEQFVHDDHSIESLTTDSFNLWDNCPAAPESSGTWLKRGWWGAEIDGVMFIRKWDRQAAVLAADSASLRSLQFGRTSPTEALARLNLTRFLFRDAHNRDHRFEFNVMGGGEFFTSCHLDSLDANGIAVPFNIDGFNPVSFDGASSMDASYASRMNSFEWNYSVTSRMERDRMELQPDGRWVRRANHGYTYHGLAGLRYLDLTENVYWSAEDIVNGTINGQDGLYRVETSNDLISFQAGGGLSYETDRWSVTLFTRGGLSLNDAKSRSELTFTDSITGTVDDDNSFISTARTGSMPLVIQGGLMGRYHLRPNVSIRAGYEFLYLTAVTLAPHEIDFVPNDGKVGTTSTPFMHGMVLGGEFYW